MYHCATSQVYIVCGMSPARIIFNFMRAPISVTISISSSAKLKVPDENDFPSQTAIDSRFLRGDVIVRRRRSFSCYVTMTQSFDLLRSLFIFKDEHPPSVASVLLPNFRGSRREGFVCDV